MWAFECELNNVLKGMLSQELNHHPLNWRIKISWHVNYFERHSRDTHLNSEWFPSASEVEEHTLNNLMDEMSRSRTIHHSPCLLYSTQGSDSMEWILRISNKLCQIMIFLHITVPWYCYYVVLFFIYSFFFLFSFI